MSAINDRFFNALERRGLRLVRVKSSKEPYEHYIVGGDCPKCHREGAKNDSKHVADRVRVYPVNPNDPRRKKGHVFCHHCGYSENGITFILDYFNLPKSEFPSIHYEVTGEWPPDRKGWVPKGAQPVRRTVAARQDGAPKSTVRPEPAGPSAWTVRPNPLPSFDWSAKATVLACHLHPAAYAAGDPALAEARHWIEEERGIALEFAADCGVFWNAKAISLSRTQCAEWGLDRHWMGIPKGVVIMQHRRYRNVTPADMAESAIPVGMQVRLAVPRPDGNRLLWIPWRGEGQDVPGVRSLALGLKGLPVVVTESALDAVLVLQEAGGWDKLAVISPCGAGYALDEDAAEWLKQAPAIWAWPDADEAGEQAFRRWQRTFPNMRKIEMPKYADGKPVAKDPTDLVKQCRQNSNLPTVRQILQKNGVAECQTICLWR